MANKISQILRNSVSDYFLKNKCREEVYKSSKRIMNCHTSKMGFHRLECEEGHYSKIRYNSCHDRNCPSCAKKANKLWYEKMSSKLIDSDYYHVVFTLPQELRLFWQYNRRDFLSKFFKSAWASLKALLADEKYMGATPGAIATFHSHSQTMTVHPHLHFLVSGSGVSKNGEIKKARKPFLLPSRALEKLFKNKLLDSLIKTQDLKTPENLTWTEKRLKLIKLFRLKWTINIQAPYKHGKGVIKYLANYVKGGVIKESRILNVSDKFISFTYKDNRNKCQNEQSKKGIMKLTTNEFLRRYLEHIPKKGTHNTRTYGIFHTSFKQSVKENQLDTDSTEEEIPKQFRQNCVSTSIPCPKCQRNLILVELEFKLNKEPPSNQCKAQTN